jgi:ATP-dependent protease ClpP protease subunit
MKLNYRNAKSAETIARFWGKPLDKPDWYKIEAKADDEAEIIIYDVIGWPFIEADVFVRELAGIKAKSIKLRINSPGGDVFDGMAIFNALKDHPARITTQIDGLAASMASVIALSGDEVTAHKNSMMMIHNAWVVVAGDRHLLGDVATNILEKIDGNMLDIYYGKAGSGKRDLRQMMDDETWLTATEAKQKGRVIESATQAKAQFSLSMYANVPDGLEGKQEGRELTEREMERALRDAGGSRSFAKAAVSRMKQPLRDVEVKTELEKLISKIAGGKQNGFGTQGNH